MRLTKTQLAARAGLSRGTVQGAFTGGVVPTADTVAVLARALRLLDVQDELLELQRIAAGKAGQAAVPRPAQADRSPPVQQRCWSRALASRLPSGIRTIWRSTLPVPAWSGRGGCPATYRAPTTGPSTTPYEKRRGAAVGCWSWWARPRPARPGRAGRPCSRSPPTGGGCGIRSIRPGPRPHSPTSNASRRARWCG
ncbi:helix-turn-helix domain-containing protein [Kitasatospora sp. KL5]|uniref:helix-turn-helix domain-containing protein n=1 Tax=Kitasatospora sp. KL5 TaxID=3425125 RepID=UPI003D6DE5BC